MSSMKKIINLAALFSVLSCITVTDPQRWSPSERLLYSLNGKQSFASSVPQVQSPPLVSFVVSFSNYHGRLKRQPASIPCMIRHGKMGLCRCLTVFLALELLNAPLLCLKGRVFAPPPQADPYYDNLLSHNPPVWWSSGQRGIYSPPAAPSWDRRMK